MTPAAHLAERSVEVALRDGSTVRVRPVLDTDEDAIRAFLESMSLESLYFRCCGLPNVKWLAKWSADVDYAERYGLVATSGGDDAIVGHAAYVRLAGDRAEVAFEVSDAVQGHGIGTLLLVHLAGVAAHNGIAVFIAQVMPSNRKMIGVFRDSGFPVNITTADGSTEVELKTSLSEEPRPSVIIEAPIRVVLAVDHAALRRSLRLVLDPEPDLAVVEEAPGSVAALPAVLRERPRVLVLDLRSHGGSSIETVRRLRSQVPDTAIVVLTMAASAAFAREVTAAGALGYVLKDLADSELPAAIRAAARGEAYVSLVLAQPIEGLSSRRHPRRRIGAQRDPGVDDRSTLARAHLERAAG